MTFAQTSNLSSHLNIYYTLDMYRKLGLHEESTVMSDWTQLSMEIHQIGAILLARSGTYQLRIKTHRSLDLSLSYNSVDAI